MTSCLQGCSIQKNQNFQNKIQITPQVDLRKKRNFISKRKKKGHYKKVKSENLNGFLGVKK